MEIVSAEIAKSRRQVLIEQMSILAVGKGFYISADEVNSVRNYAWTAINSKGIKEIKVSTNLPKEYDGKAMVWRSK